MREERGGDKDRRAPGSQLAVCAQGPLHFANIARFSDLVRLTLPLPSAHCLMFARKLDWFLPSSFFGDSPAGEDRCGGRVQLRRVEQFGSTMAHP